MVYAPVETAESRLRRGGWTVTAQGCWESCRFKTSKGYTYVRYNGVRQGTHRLAYETWVGPIPEGHVVRHKCDNHPCINPDHLETGTHADNARDKVERGRAPRGDSHWASKVTEREFLALVEEKERGVIPVKMLIELYGLSEKAFYNRLRKVR